MMIGLITLLAAVIGFTTSRFLITPQYESTSQLYVLSKSTSLTSLADIQMGTSLTNDYLVVVTGRPVLEQVAQMALMTRAIRPDQPPLPQWIEDKHFLRKHGPNAYYGQR